MPEGPLSIWTIYEKPADFPDHFVARRWEAVDPPRPTDELFMNKGADALPDCPS